MSTAMIKTLTTVDDVIAMFGSPAKAARWARTSDQAVCNWRRRGIPPSAHLRLLIEARKRGRLVGNEVLGLEPEEWFELYTLIGPPAEPVAAE